MHNPTDQSGCVGQKLGTEEGVGIQKQAEELPVLQRQDSVGD